MKFGLTTSTYRSVELYEAVRRIRAFAYDAIEITAVPGQHIATDRFGPDECKQFKAELERIGLAASAITSGPCAPFAGEEALQYVRSSIDVAHRLGAQAVITYAPMTDQAASAGEAQWRPDLCARLAALADYAAKNGVFLALETEPGLLVGTPRLGIAIIREVAHPSLRYNLCVPHILPAIAPEETVHDIIELAAGLIVNTHLADVKNRVHKHLVPGQGEVDFKAVFAHLERAGYKGYLTWDLYPYADESDYAAGATMDFLRKLGRAQAASA